jgi:hypothetical protein
VDLNNQKLFTSQSSIDSLNGQISKLGPKRLNIFQRDHRVVAEINNLDGHRARVQLGVDLDTIPLLITMQGGKVHVLGEVLQLQRVVFGWVCVKIFHGRHQSLELGRLLIRLNLEIVEVC